MKVLLCTEFYHSLGGGYAFAIDSQKLLESAGHEVIPFAAKHPGNLPSRASRHFIPYGSYLDTLHGRQWWRAPAALARLATNPAAALGLSRMIRQYRPDVVHTHIISTYLTQVVWEVAHDAGLPVLHTLHDYKLLCPDTCLLSRGRVCRRCKGNHFYHCLFRRCKRGSTAASAAAVFQACAQRVARRAERCVDAFVAPSRFIMREHVAWGLRRSKVYHIPNFTNLSSPAPTRKPGQGFLYVGRLSREKGVDVLVDAARLRPHVQFTIAGDGELREELAAAAPPNVCFLGHVHRDVVPDLLAACRALVVPSVWYENCSLSILEALAAGVPVIGSDIGGIPEQVADGETGLSVEPGDPGSLAEAIDRMDVATAQRMGRAARERAERLYSPSVHLDGLLSLYRRLLSVAST